MKKPNETASLTHVRGSDKVCGNSWRGGRAAECAGFENRSARKGSGSSHHDLRSFLLWYSANNCVVPEECLIPQRSC